MENEELLKEARKRYKIAAEYDSDNHEAWNDDVEFLHGDQWPEGVEGERKLSGRPSLTRNRLPAFVGQLISDARQNSPSIQVHPMDDSSDPELAKIYEGLIRQIESHSHADQAYDNALEHAASGGIGAFRITTDYTMHDSFEQDIKIQRITTPLAICIDPNANEYDKSDAMWMFYSEMIDDEEFEERWPDAEKVEWESSGNGDERNFWKEKDQIRVAEYWVKEPKQKTLAQLGDGSVIDITEKEIPPGLEIRSTRTVESYKILRYMLAGNQILEGPEEWPGRFFPFIMVYGPEVFIKDKIYYRSVHRYAKDAQRMYNYWSSAIAEKVALSPKAPYIGTVTQFEGYEEYWDAANTENRAYLPYNPDPLAPGPPQRNSPALLNSGELQAAEQCIEDMKATMGIFDASLGAQSNETSGRAIIARQREGDSATFPWIDNLNRSIQHAGRVLVDLIPKIYDSERVIRVLGIDEKEEFIPINKVVRDPRSGEVFTFNDLTTGKYDVTISTGPSYQTQRLEAADQLIQLAQAVPSVAALIPDLIAGNLDIKNAEEIARRLKRTLPPGVLDPDDKDAPQPQGPSPQEQLALAEFQQKLKDMEIKGVKTQAEAEGQKLDNAQKQLELAAQSGQLQELVAQQVQQILLQMFQPSPQPELIPQQ